MLRTLPRLLAALLFLGLFTSRLHAETSEADSKKAAEAAMVPWLETIDRGDYAQSWSEASAFFREALTQEKWIAALKQARTPLGECRKRKLASMLLQSGAPLPDGKKIKGPLAVAQFQSSFANLFAAIETVSFEQQGDGIWRAAGYYIKPAVE